ncbi:Clp protease N-terminal domain-containing protein [Hyphomicrobium sulfonivorans]|uniref:Clp protease N-terminal domain-containing protein n=1 Tax=Hyphomicrobium sulfonivorans TaxID=121290 RepID=UPI00156FEF4A|nr:Clp protease N-terminal domain-containing protein [Hyphomicrobium sulfonivorans]MBI1649765.1 hypothetical protein [Hyphomicrobium sulfonivorans]NSL71681.1 hypothetical protein [Hyphomicrobium sulfonivorans]
MDYRGPDLDLRTTRWSTASVEGAASSRRDTGQHAAGGHRLSTARSGPIWVDETLLACANHAYDVAEGYRAAEVSISHLLLAMTRVEDAADILEQRGIRVAALRRESAITVAGDPPTLAADDAPRRAPELEDVLRLAAARASHFGRAASVDDIVLVLADIGADLPGSELVVRYVPRTRELRGTVPPLTLSQPQPQPAPQPPPPPVEKVVVQPQIDPALLKGLLDRVGELERSLVERIGSLETVIVRQPLPPPTDLSPLANRLADLETAIAAQGKREAERPLDADLAARLSAIENVITAKLSDVAAGRGHFVQLAEQLAERLTAIESAVASGANATSAVSAVRAFDTSLAPRFAAFASRLDGIEVGLKSLTEISSETSGARSPLDATLIDRVAARLASIEQALATESAERSSGITALADEITGVRSAVRLASQNSEQGRVALNAEVKQLAETFERLRADLATAVERRQAEIAASLEHQRAALASGLDQHRGSLTNGLNQYRVDFATNLERVVDGLTHHRAELTSGFKGRFGDLERRIEANGVRLSEAQAAYNFELREVHDALVNIGTSQKTIASALDTWHDEGSTEIQLINGRISALHEGGMRVQAGLETLAGHVDALTQLLLEDRKRRGSFRRWLYGTDDWIRASWRRVTHPLLHWPRLSAWWRRQWYED